jgi:CRP/FNR family transcriptional regulator
MINEEILVERLASVHLFKHLPNQAIKKIVYAGNISQYPAGSILFREGEPCAGLFVIFKGQVHLYKLGIQGQEAIITSIRPVIMFNEVPVLDGGTNTVTAIAMQDCITWCISYENFQNLMKSYPELGTGLLNTLAFRNRRLMDQYEDLLSRPVISRVAKVLLILSECGNTQVNRYRYDNQKLAALAATVPEAISRCVKILKNDRIIDASRGKIIVLSRDQLCEKALLEPMDFRYYQNNLN